MAKDKYWENIKKQGIAEAKRLAKEASKELQEKALEQTYDFYQEYDPIFYKRHLNEGTDSSGLAKSIISICKSENHGRGWVGGIEISTTHMYKDYSGTPFQVLTSYLDGFHGLPTEGNYLRDVNNTRKFNQLIKYKNAIIRRFK